VGGREPLKNGGGGYAWWRCCGTQWSWSAAKGVVVKGDAHQPWQLHAHGPAPHLHCIHQHRSRPWQQHSPSSATANTNPIAAPAPQHCAAVKREETPTRTRFHHLHCSTSLKNMNQSRHQQPWHPSTTEKWRWGIRVVALLWDPVVVECGGGGGGEDAVRFVVIANGWSSGCGWSWRVRNGREDAARST